MAISWIALRITIKTYKTSSTSRNGASFLQNQHRRQLRTSLRSPPPPPPLGPASHALARLFGPNPSSPSSSLHRFYMMAAAAAAANAISRQSATAAAAANASSAAQSSSTTSQEVQTARSASRSSSASTNNSDNDNDNHETSGSPSNSNGPMSLLCSIKERLPRRLARLIPYSSLSEEQTTRLGNQSPARSTRPPFQAGLNNTSMETTAQQTAVPNPAVLAALLHQYFLFPPPNLAHPGAHFGLPPPGDTFNFRPPPPSYNASMQDTRLRMLMQERAHLNSMFSCGNPTGSAQGNTATATSNSTNHGSLQVTPSGHNSNSQQPQEQPEPQSAASEMTIEAYESNDRLTSSRQQQLARSGRHSLNTVQPAANSEQKLNSSLSVRTGGCSMTSTAPSASSHLGTTSRAVKRTKTTTKQSLSRPTLVNNDIYVSSSTPLEVGSELASQRSSDTSSAAPRSSWLQNSTVVNICSGASNSTNSPNQDEENAETSANQRHEVKILGYL